MLIDMSLIWSSDIFTLKTKLSLLHMKRKGYW